MLNNPRKFDHWFKLRQDILFNGLTIEEAAEKYKINKRSISRHLKTYPRIKEAYYSRPWAASGKHRMPQQLQIQFLAQICEQTQEALEDIYSEIGPYIYPPGSELHKTAMVHLMHCDICQEYEKYLQRTKSLPYRYDCPSLEKMYSTLGKNNVDITEHFLDCYFCPVEFEGLQQLPTEKALQLIDKEIDFHPRRGWNSYLKPFHYQMISDIINNPIFKSQGLPSNYIANLGDQTVQSYFRWRIFRRPLFEIGLTVK